MGLGVNVRRIREELGITQRELADRVGYKSRSTIAKIESGERSVPGSVVAELAAALETTPEKLVGWEYGSDNSDEQNNEMIRRILSAVFGPELGRAIHEDYCNGDLDRDIIKLSLDNIHLRRFHELDSVGQLVVEGVIDLEHERCFPTIKPSTRLRTFPITMSLLPVSAGTGQFLSDELTSIIEIPDTPFNRTADFVVQVSGDSMEPEYSDDDLLLVRKQPQVYEGEIGIFVVNGEGFVKKLGQDRLISINPEYKDIRLSEFDNVICFGKVIGKV